MHTSSVDYERVFVLIGISVMFSVTPLWFKYMVCMLIGVTLCS